MAVARHLAGHPRLNNDRLGAVFDTALFSALLPPEKRVVGLAPDSPFSHRSRHAPAFRVYPLYFRVPDWGLDRLPPVLSPRLVGLYGSRRVLAGHAHHA